MSRSILMALLLASVATTAVAQEDSRDVQLEKRRAEAEKLLEKAYVLSKTHWLDDASQLLERVMVLDPNGRAGLRACLLHAEILTRRGRLEAAADAVRKPGERWKKHPELAAKADLLARAVQAAREARALAVKALEARMAAREAEATAEIAKAKAHLMLGNAPANEIEAHLHELHVRAQAEMKDMLRQIEAIRAGKAHHEGADPDRAAALVELLRKRGMPEDRAREQAARLLAAYDKARRAVEEARGRLEELEHSRGKEIPDHPHRLGRARQAFEAALARLAALERARHGEFRVEPRKHEIVEILKHALEALHESREPVAPRTSARLMEAIERYLRALDERRRDRYEEETEARERWREREEHEELDEEEEEEEDEHEEWEERGERIDEIEERMERMERQLEEMRELLERVLKDR